MVNNYTFQAVYEQQIQSKAGNYILLRENNIMVSDAPNVLELTWVFYDINYLVNLWSRHVRKWKDRATYMYDTGSWNVNLGMWLSFPSILYYIDVALAYPLCKNKSYNPLCSHCPIFHGLVFVPSLFIHIFHYHIETPTNGWLLADDIFNVIFLNENCCILTRISRNSGLNCR